MSQRRAAWTLKDVALFTGLSPRTIARLNAQRRGPPQIRLSRKTVLYRPEAVEEWLRALEEPQPRAAGTVDS